MKCDRQLCGAKAAADDVFDACAHCGKTLCHIHMSEGCCRHTPALSETVAQCRGVLSVLIAKRMMRRPAILYHYAQDGRTGTDMMHPGCFHDYENETGLWEYADIARAAEWWQQRELDLGNAHPEDFNDNNLDYCRCDGCGETI